MPEGYVPSVFVSSTCYDLSQLRSDISRAITEIGLEPVVSESIAFPINPSVAAVENCLQVVKSRADIFVLIVGARYGTQRDSGRSVTNLEYLEAKAKGIPIYVFVTKAILHILPVWRRNRAGDFSDTVDTTKLFEFVDEVRTAEGHWVFEFEHASHFIDTLKKQLAYLFMDALLVRQRLQSLRLSAQLSDLPSESLRLLMEKGGAWEHFFFASVLESELHKNEYIKWDVHYSVSTGKVRSFAKGDADDISAMLGWISAKLSGAKALMETASKLLNVAIQKGMGPPGVPVIQNTLFMWQGV